MTFEHVLFAALISFFAWFAIWGKHIDVDGFCPMALNYIEIDKGSTPLSVGDKALKSWLEFSEYYRCEAKGGGK